MTCGPCSHRALADSQKTIFSGISDTPCLKYCFKIRFLRKILNISCQTGWSGDENTMVKISQKIVPHIWLEKDAEKAAEFYVSVFKNSMILKTSYYPKAAEEVSGQKEGSVMTVRFKLEGQEFMALNGGPVFKLNEAVSFMVFCDTQEEIDYFWNKLSFVKEAEQCGWLKDKFGLSWQIVPTILDTLISDKDPQKAEKVTEAFLKMKKFDISALKKAYEG